MDKDAKKKNNHTHVLIFVILLITIIIVAWLYTSSYQGGKESLVVAASRSLVGTLSKQSLLKPIISRSRSLGTRKSAFRNPTSTTSKKRVRFNLRKNTQRKFDKNDPSTVFK